MSQPSPTPYTGWRPLIPSSPREPQPLPGCRNRLRRGPSTESLTLSGLSGWRRQPKQPKRPSGQSEERMSLGMGMMGTPAKRKTLSRKASIGATSTPKAGRLRSLANPRPSLSEVDSLRSTSDIPLDSSSQALSSPSISGTEANTIQVGEPLGNDGLTSVSYQSQRWPRDGPGFVDSQDMVVPLNDVGLSPSRELDGAVQPTLSNETAGMELDITVPLNDLSSVTHTTPRASQTVSKITQRQSTPYRSRQAVGDARRSDEQDSEDDALQVARNQKHGEGADNHLDRNEQHPLGTAPVDDTWSVAGSFAAQAPLTPKQDTTIHTLADTGAAKYPHTTATRPLTPRPQHREVLSVQGSLRPRHSSTHNKRPRVMPEVDRREHEWPTMETRGTGDDWRDPFGFWIFCQTVQSRSPRRYHTSAPSRHLVQHCPTPLSFRSLSPLESLVADVSFGVSSQPPSSPAEAGWRGAPFLARMEGQADEDYEQRPRVGRNISRGRRRDKAGSRIRREREALSDDCFAEEDGERAKRIQHYKDLNINYQLAVEEVWG
ncbi:hypothetical protein IAR50_003535 [Cryptococcus sp. DSM 104548]